MNQTQALKKKPFNLDEWQKLYYRHQQQYIRNRLDAIKLLEQGNSRAQVCQQVGCSYDTLTSWLAEVSQWRTQRTSQRNYASKTISIVL